MINTLSLSEEPCRSSSPTDGIKKLTDWFESCSLDDDQFNKNCFWSTQKIHNNPTRPIISVSSNSTFNSNSFSLSQTSTASLFDQQHATTNSEISTKKEALILQQSSPKIFFPTIMFTIGLMLGYLLTNALPFDLLRHWFSILEKTSH